MNGAERPAVRRCRAPASLRIAARVVLSCAAVCASSGAPAATQRLILLHDNDLHGHLRSFCYVERALGTDERCNVGGAARRSTLIEALRAGADAPVLLVDAGDTTTRGPLATLYEGSDEIDAMNAMRYDIATIGNNEFKLKDGADAEDARGAQAALARLIRRSRFPWLCANATDANGALMTGVQPFVVRTIGAIRVAFIGLTAPRSRAYPQTRGLVIGDPVAAAKLWIPQARAEADVVVAVTHLGVDDDRRLVSETRGIDALIGGDSHTFLYEPLSQRNVDGVAVPIVQDGEFGVRLGRLELLFEGDAAHGWHLRDAADRLIPVDAALRPDPDIDAIVEGYASVLDARAGGFPATSLPPPARRTLTAQALAEAWKATAATDVGLEREDDLYDTFTGPEISRYAVHSVIPFHETIWRGVLSGEQLRLLLASSTTYGGRLRSTLREEDIDPLARYTVATTTFLATSILPQGEDTGKDSRASVEAWLAGRASP